MPRERDGRASPHYVEGVCCERCHATRTDDQRARYAERHRQMEIARRRGEVHLGAARKD